MNVCVFLILSLLFKGKKNWIVNWKEDDKIITNSSCLTNDNSCFSTNQETIIIDSEEATMHVTAYTKNPCVCPFKYLNKTYHSCTRKDGFSRDHSNEEAFWCATSVDDDLDSQSWGFCNDLCQLEGKVQIF